MGGSSGGGGGGSGVVDYPDYMKTVHGKWLDNAGGDTPANSLVDAINAAYGSSPWTAATAYDPATDITAYEAAISGFATILAGIVDTADWAALYTQAEASIDITDVTDTSDVTGITNAEIVADVDAFADSLDDEITTKVLPRFQSGMRDINAVVSSSFVIGQSVIEGFRDREVAKHESGLRLSAAHKNADIELANETLHLEVKKLNVVKESELVRNRALATDQMLRLMLQRISFEDSYMKTVIEGKRIKIVANKEENDVNLKIDESDAMWDLEIFQHGANMLAAIGGGTATPKGKEPSQMQSVIGGAMAGAAAGSMISPGWGTAIGAVLGAASAYMN